MAEVRYRNIHNVREVQVVTLPDGAVSLECLLEGEDHDHSMVLSPEVFDKLHREIVAVVLQRQH